jgi:hypothetical protein
MGGGILPNQDRFFLLNSPIKMLGSINLNMASSFSFHATVFISL